MSTPRKHKKSNSLRARVLVAVGFCVTVIVSILIFYNSRYAHEQSVEYFKKEAQAMAQEKATELEQTFNDAFSTVWELAHVFRAKVNPDYPLELSRDDANHLIRSCLEGHPDYYAIYVSFEPDAYDTLDAYHRQWLKEDTVFANKLGCDSFGHFSPYWYRDNGEIVLEPCNYTGTDWYEIPKSTRDELLTTSADENDEGETVWLVTIEAPILHDGEFYGITGVDYEAGWLQDWVRKIDDMDGQVNLSVIGSDGVIIASSHHDSLATVPVSQVPDLIPTNMTSISNGQYIQSFDDEQLFVGVPVSPGYGGYPWQVTISIPRDLVVAEAQRIQNQSILFSLIALAAGLVLIYLLITQLFRPLRKMVTLTSRIAVGDLTEEDDHTHYRDEFGQMKESLDLLVEGLRKTRDFAKHIGEGNLQAEHETLSDKDELGLALMEMRDNLSAIAAADDKRNWVNKGQAMFAEIMREESENTEDLSLRVVRSLVKYTDCNQGAIFIYDPDTDEERPLLLSAAYAWDRRKFKNRRLRLGEGMIGQCFREGKRIYMTDVPDDYIKITSGIGKALPRSILIVPMMVNNEVLGVVEMAAFHDFGEHRIKFVESVAESIAAALSSVRSNSTTRRLLDQARKQREELMAQEEELRQNQEELQATHEELDRVAKELRMENADLKKRLGDDV